MPLRQLSEAETNLVDVLKQYYENHKTFYLSALDCMGILEARRELKFENEEYIGSLSLLVAQSICLTTDPQWHRVLKKHGMYSDFFVCSTADYLPMIIRALQKISIKDEQDHNLKQAIQLSIDPQNADLIASRLKLIREYSDARLKNNAKSKLHI